MAQPPLSAHIETLVAAVGTPLFRRAAHGMEIIEAGNALFRRAKEALLLANEGFDAPRAAGSGSREPGPLGPPTRHQLSLCATCTRLRVRAATS